MPDKQLTPTKSLIPKEVAEQLLAMLYHYFGMVIFLVLAIFLYSAWYFILNPKYDAVSSGEELNKKNAEVLVKSQYLRQLQTLQKMYDEINPADIDKIKQIVDRDNDSNGLLKELDYIITDNGMKALEIKSVPTEDSFEIVNYAGSSKRSDDLLKSTRVWRTTVQIANVDYFDLRNALRTIEYNIRLMDVQALSYDPVKKTASIELLTYHRK
jgi:hypothetical protein